MSYALIVMDYFLQQIGAGYTVEEAEERSYAFTSTLFGENTGHAEYMPCFEIVERMANAIKEA